METTEIGERLRALRYERGLTQVELAKMSGLQQPTISAIERGDTKEPEGESLRRLANALAVSIEELTGVTAPETLPPEEREEMCERFDRLDIDEQRTLLRLVRRLSVLPPDRGPGAPPA